MWSGNVNTNAVVNGVYCFVYVAFSGHGILLGKDFEIMKEI
jgi:hypothetical protein